MKLVIWIIASILSAVLYRMGGSGHYPRQTRIVGCPLVTTIGLLIGIKYNFNVVNCLMLGLSFGLSIGAISTYWNKKNADETFINYFLHGLGIALAMLPYVIATGHWIGFGIRLLVLPLAMGIWSIKTNYDILEECGRGALISLTMPLLLI